MTFFTNAQLVLADEVVHGSVHTNGALIQSVDAGTSSLPGGIDLEGLEVGRALPTEGGAGSAVELKKSRTS